jgi:hypothetical protein
MGPFPYLAGPTFLFFSFFFFLLLLSVTASSLQHKQDSLTICYSCGSHVSMTKKYPCIAMGENYFNFIIVISKSIRALQREI